jgi:hypothetical protein
MNKRKWTDQRAVGAIATSVRVAHLKGVVLQNTSTAYTTTAILGSTSLLPSHKGTNSTPKKPLKRDSKEERIVHSKKCLILLAIAE